MQSPSTSEGDGFVERGLIARSEMLNCQEVMYLDSEEKLQGPFEKKKMLQWWKKGYLPAWLRVRAPNMDRFVHVDVLLASWFSDAQEWQVRQGNATWEGMFKQETLISWFLAGDLDPEHHIVPSTYSDYKQSIAALFLMVYWLPFSTTWLIKEPSDLIQTLSVQAAFQLWQGKYGMQEGCLTARPASWNCNCFIPLETLLKSCGVLDH